jgi:hypothetical protein
MPELPVQSLRILPGTYDIGSVPAAEAPGDRWLALVRAPEGLTVVREVESGEWIALYGDDPHELDLPGMLSAVVGPLAAASVPVFVNSTLAADLVLVPRDRLSDALVALRSAGHAVREPA